MLNLINHENFRKFTYSNDAFCTKPYKGIVVQFHGLGDADIFNEDLVGLDETKEKTHAQNCGEFYAKRGILYIVPYTNPWCWMNDNTVKFVDKLVSILIEKYNMQDYPIISTGPSMGGQSAILYSLRSAFIKNIPACVVNCPVCDVLKIANSDLAFRTLFSSFYQEGKDFYETIKNYSPMELVSNLRDIDYFVFQCDKDSTILKEIHADRFVEKLKNHGFKVKYHVQQDREHCQINGEIGALYKQYIVDSIDKFNNKK